MLRRNINQGRERCLLAILYYATRTQLEALVSGDELCYDDHLEDFRRLVALCEQFLQPDIDSEHHGGTRRASDGVVGVALYLVGCKCQNPEVRRAAIRPLYRCRRLEGLWSTTMLGLIAEQVMILEEEMLKPFPTSKSIRSSTCVKITSFHHSPGLLCEKQEDWSNWEKDPPQIDIMYEPSQTYTAEPHAVRIALKPYSNSTGFDPKCDFLWPAEGRFPILDEIIGEESKALDGPRLGFSPFSGLVNEDLQNRLRMRPFMMLVA